MEIIYKYETEIGKCKKSAYQKYEYNIQIKKSGYLKILNFSYLYRTYYPYKSSHTDKQTIIR